MMNNVLWCTPDFLHHGVRFDFWPITETEKLRVLHLLEENKIFGFVAASAFTVWGVPAVRVTWPDGGTQTLVVGAGMLDYAEE